MTSASQSTPPMSLDDAIDHAARYGNLNVIKELINEDLTDILKADNILSHYSASDAKIHSIFPSRIVNKE